VAHLYRHVVAVTGGCSSLMNSPELNTAERLETPFAAALFNEGS
jgi:thiamine pyrophosphate-dependent acetolactate synthase large subunit-like protein